MAEQVFFALPIATFDKFFSKSYQIDIIKWVWRERQHASPDANNTLQRLTDVLNKSVPHPGFRSKNAGLVPNYHQYLFKILHEQPQLQLLLFAVLQVWTDLQRPLIDKMREFMGQRQIASLDPEQPLLGFSPLLSPSWVDELANEFLLIVGNAELNRDDVRLAIMCLVGEPTESMQLTDTPPIASEQLLWIPWLEALRTLPPESAEWESITDFVNQVLALADQKKQALQALQAAEARQQQMRTVLDELILNAEQHFEYIGAQEIHEWRSRTPPSDVDIVTTQLTEFGALVAEYFRLKEQTALNMTEEREIRQRSAQLESEIIALFQVLQIAFSTGNATEVINDEATYENAASSTTKSPSNAIPPAVDESPLDHNLADALADFSTPLIQNTFTGVRSDEPSEITVEWIETPVFTNAVPQPKYVDVSTMQNEQAPVQETDHEGSPTFNVVSATDLARALDKDEDQEQNWDLFFWKLIAQDDLPAAYWLAYSFEQASYQVGVTASDLAIVQVGRWLEPGMDAYVDNLAELLRQSDSTGSDAQEVIRLAAAVQALLIAPTIGLIDWLQTPACCPTVHELVRVLSTFANAGIALRPEGLLNAENAQQRSAKLQQVVQQAREWLDQELRRKLSYQRATKVLLTWCKPGGDLHSLLSPVISDRRVDAASVAALRLPLTRPEYVKRLIETTDRQFVAAGMGPIEGRAQKLLLHAAGEACGIAQQWLTLVHREDELTQYGSNWLSQRVVDLRVELEQVLPGVAHALEAQQSSLTEPALSAAWLCLRRAIGQVHALLNLNGALNTPPTTTWTELAQPPGDPTVALARRLLWLPEVELGDDGLPCPEKERLDIARALKTFYTQPKPLVEVFRARLANKDFRFFEEWLLPNLIVTQDAGALREYYTAELQEARAALVSKAQGVSNTIESALLDGVLADEERGQKSDELQQAELSASLNLGSQFIALDSIQQQLDDKRQQRCSDLEKIWRALEPQLGTAISDAAHRQQVQASISDALMQKNTRIVEEYVDNLRQVVENGLPFDESLFEHKSERDPLSEFLASEDSIRTWLTASRSLSQVADDIQAGQVRADIHFGDIPRKRRDEAYRAIEGWRTLKQRVARRGNTDLEWERAIAEILSYLGIEVDKVASSITNFQVGDGWVMTQIQSENQPDTRPIPQFGSQAKRRYTVVCFWERPGAGTIAARLRELGLMNQQVIIFYLGQMTALQRRELARVSREKELAVVILDEILLVFLAIERDTATRLRTLLRCALPFTVLNPYTPFQAGDVPPEMFFGREDMINELRKPDGSCLIYGGRQMGKSALLRHVQREFHRPDQGQYAVLLDIKLIGGAGTNQTPETILIRLRDALIDLKLLKPQQASTNNSDTLTGQIKDTLNKVSNRRLLVLFDEADNFLDADAQSFSPIGNRPVVPFPIVERLRMLMMDTGRHFKVVFAGLHNVQRFQGIANQPLAHFGRPLQIGPLDARAAQQLVQQPLEFLGYHISTDLSLRILSYTNYHPGLIQIFCRELLQQLWKRLGNNSLPPYQVQDSEVDALYRKNEVRAQIRDRFDWTLALDMRYQAIAWTLIDDQSKDRDSYARAYTPRVILDQVRVWWERGFDKIDISQLSGLLDEMCGLGVLVYDKTKGSYRLRSPNLVRLMGSESHIQDRLGELIDKQPPVAFSAEYHHAPLDSEAQGYSPLTYAQERLLTVPQSGASVIIASEALALHTLVKALNFFQSREALESSKQIDKVPPNVQEPVKLRQWLEQHLKKVDSQERTVIYCRPHSLRGQMLAPLIQEAAAFAEKWGTRKRSLRIVFVLDPAATWEWVSLTPGTREELEKKVGVPIAVNRWETTGLVQRLEQHNKIHNEDALQKILEATQGWPYLLDELFKQISQDDDPSRAAAWLNDELNNSETALYGQFGKSLGVEPGTPAARVLNVIGQYQPLNVVDITPDNVSSLGNSSEPLSEATCKAAFMYLQLMSCIEIYAGNQVGVNPIVNKLVKALTG